MKTLKSEDIKKVYEELGLLDEDKIEVKSELNEGNLNNSLSYSFVAPYEEQNLLKPYYRV